MTGDLHDMPSPRTVFVFLIGALLAIGSLGTLRSIVNATNASGASGPAMAVMLGGLILSGLGVMYGAARTGGLLKPGNISKTEEPTLNDTGQNDASPSG